MTTEETEASLTYEELAYTIKGLPLVFEDGPKAGQVDRRLAFETAEALGQDGVENLRAFVALVTQFSRLEGGASPPGSRAPGEETPMRLEDLVTGRLEKVQSFKARTPLMDQVWHTPNEVEKKEPAK